MEPPVADTPNQAWARALAAIAPLKNDPLASLPRLFDALAERHADRPALTSDHATLTYRELAEARNRIARWGLRRKLGAGQTVALMMESGPSYIASWLGLTQTGATVALLNTELGGAALIHAITASAARMIVVDPVFHQAALAISKDLPWPVEIHVPGGGQYGGGIDSLDAESVDNSPLSAAECPPPPASATALLVFTSGTTGLPKAARISHYRVLEWSAWFGAMMKAGPDDCLYDCLPLFHSTGGIAAIGGVLLHGGSVVLRPRFSAQRFWTDVANQGCTLFLYIGELCRYLLAQPETEQERAHSLRLCCGNGLREDVWRSFQARFGIPRILEFYASTEGNVSLYNCEGRPGAVGRLPTFLRHRFPVALVAVDPETGEAARNEAGWCRRCAPGEAGEALGLIATAGTRDPGAFDGYTDADATERKILRNAFALGDAWFRTGDLMRQDDAGFFYFIDRLGDTFRWKGENVSATQVADTLSRFPGVTQAVVFGVRVDGEEGRAGMAAITVSPEFAIGALPGFLAAELPRPAWPLWLRICGQLAATATFKPVKTKLAAEGYDAPGITDPLYHYEGGQYRLCA